MGMVADTEMGFGAVSVLARCTSLVALALAMPAFAQTAPQKTLAADPAAQDASEDKGVGLGDIVVTARRREEGLLSVPVSVTAIGSAELTHRIHDGAVFGQDWHPTALAA